MTSRLVDTRKVYLRAVVGDEAPEGARKAEGSR